MKAIRNICTCLSPSDLHFVLQFPSVDLKKNLCVSANLCAETKELVLITANQTVHTIPTSNLKSTDKADVEWGKMELIQLGAMITFGNISFKTSDLINKYSSQELSLTNPEKTV